MSCEAIQSLMKQNRHSLEDIGQFVAHIKECDGCRKPFEEAEARLVSWDAKGLINLVRERAQRAGYGDEDIEVHSASGECRGTVPGLPDQGSYLPPGSGIGDPYEDCMWASELNAHDGIHTDERGRWRVILNHTSLFGTHCNNNVVLVREKEGLSLASSDEPPPFATMLGEDRVLPIVLTHEELLWVECRWVLARRRRMDEVNGISMLEQFVAAAVPCCLDLNGITFRVRPLPSDGGEVDVVYLPVKIVGDEIYAHLKRLYQQLLPHLTPEERALLSDPRVVARTFFVEGLNNMLD